VQLTKEVEKHKNTSHFWFAKVAVSGTELQTGLILKPEPGSDILLRFSRCKVFSITKMTKLIFHYNSAFLKHLWVTDP